MYLAGTLPFMSNWSYELDVSYKFFTWQGIRNYIMVNRSYSWLALLALLTVVVEHRRQSPKNSYLEPAFWPSMTLQGHPGQG